MKETTFYFLAVLITIILTSLIDYKFSDGLTLFEKGDMNRIIITDTLKYEPNKR